MTMITPSAEQQAALDKIAAWFEQPIDEDNYNPSDQTFYLSGYAGTGKTTLLPHIKNIVADYINSSSYKGEEHLERWSPQICNATFTGKAALVMRKKGISNAQTLHSLIYKVVPGSSPVKFYLSDESALEGADLLCIDEVSMVGESLGKDVESFGTKILVLGDPGQLPPVEGTGYFTSRPWNHLLTEVHRQAKESPIIRWATAVRTGAGIGKVTESKPIREGECEVIRQPYTARGSKITVADKLYQMALIGSQCDQVICGTNNTRQNLNKFLKHIRFPGAPTDRPTMGDRLICLRNNRDKGLLNGSQWTVSSTPTLEDGKWWMEVESLDFDGLTQEVNVPVEFFNGKIDELDKTKLRRDVDQFDFGYAITCHKSQGSQWDSVFVYNEGYAFRENAARWLYTAITRAAKKLILAV